MSACRCWLSLLCSTLRILAPPTTPLNLQKLPLRAHALHAVLRTAGATWGSCPATTSALLRARQPARQHLLLGRRPRD